MRFVSLLLLIALVSVGRGAEPPSTPSLEISQFVAAPVGGAYVVCLDQAASGARVILLADSGLQKPVFYCQTQARWTEVHWSPDGRRCVLANAPTNAGPDMWLLAHYKGAGWTIRKFDPFAQLDRLYYQHWDGRNLTRDGFEQFRWLDNRRFAFVIDHKLGEYQAEIDGFSQNLKPILHKLP